jgi:hypothetical protein
LTVYPNPCENVLSIGFQIAEKTVVEISIYNMMGIKIATLLKSSQTPGYHTLSWSFGQGGSTIEKGVYLILLRSGNSILYKEVIKLK